MLSADIALADDIDDDARAHSEAPMNDAPRVVDSDIRLASTPRECQFQFRALAKTKSNVKKKDVQIKSPLWLRSSAFHNSVNLLADFSVSN